MGKPCLLLSEPDQCLERSGKHLNEKNVLFYANLLI